MRRAGLRTRVAVTFGAGSLALSAALAGVTFELTRSSALDVRERASVRSARGDAQIVDRGTLAADADVVGVLASLDTGRSRIPLLHRDGTWFARTADDGLTGAVPPALLRLVESGRPAVQRARTADGTVLVVGVPLSTRGASYVEVDDLAELNGTLRDLAGILTLVAAATTLAGAALGSWAARRLLRPLQDMADAASRISAGDLDTRLAPVRDPHLAPLSSSFNRMVGDLSLRIERDRRFAADVSHELRSPLQTLSNATTVLQNRVGRMDDRTRAATELVHAEVARFSALVQDLLELAREEHPAEPRATDVVALVREECRHRGVPEAVLDVDDAAPAWWVEPRRFRGVVGNLVDNAERHGGGVVRVRLHELPEQNVLVVEDAGPGVPVEERGVVFDRFGRGRRSCSRRDTDGTGLGLALVAAHASAHGAEVRIEDRPGGGARFVVTFPSGPGG